MGEFRPAVSQLVALDGALQERAASTLPTSKGTQAVQKNTQGICLQYLGRVEEEGVVENI